MRTKIDKNQILIKDNMDNKNQAKNVNKVVSPKNLLTKGLVSVKSEKDLTRKLFIKQQKSKIQTSLTISVAQSSQNDSKPGSKILLGKQTKDNKNENKIQPSTKISDNISPKSNGGHRFFRTKNPANQKEEENTKKQMQIKDEKIEQLQKKYQQLLTKLQIMSMQKQKNQQILSHYKSEKEQLQKNLQKLKNVAAENRKLLKLKADGFNNNGTEIQHLKQQLQQLKSKNKISSQCEIGTNTQLEQIQKLPQCQSIANNPQKSLSENRQSDLSHEHKTQQTQETTDYYNLLSGINVEDNLKLTIMKNLYEKIIADKNIKINEKDQIIYQQQCQLNDFYEKKFSRSQQIIPNLQTSEDTLLQMQEINQLKRQLAKQSQRRYKLMQQVRDRDRGIEDLKRQIKIKDIYYQSDLGGFFNEQLQNNKICSKSEVQKLKKEIQDLKSEYSLKQSNVQELEKRIESQQIIIKALRQKKPKIIVK